MYPTIDELIKYGDKLGFDVKAIIMNCDRKRKLHRNAWNGFTRDRSGRFEAEIPRFCVDNHPELKKLFDKNMDKHERNKNYEKFYRLYPQFLIVDRYGSNLSVK